MGTPRLLLAAPSSGSGKTTVACAILEGLKQKGYHPAAFKCGPDYIDPMFHARVLKQRCTNLDPFLVGEDGCRKLLKENARQADMVLKEGVMGYYDGVTMSSGEVVSSTHHLADITQTPAILVVDAKGMDRSVAALIQGFLRFVPESYIAGVLLNRVGRALAMHLKEMIEECCGIPVVGYLPPLPECALESRHLGLVTAQEVSDWQQKIQRLGQEAVGSIDWDMLLGIAQKAPDLICDPPEQPFLPRKAAPVIAVARDAAFCFYYEDNLQMLQQMGAELVYFSPLSDSALPEKTSGLYLGGGYPELYGDILEGNASMRHSIREALEQGMPCIAECGGFLYLQQTLETQKGTKAQMVGFLPGDGYRTSALRRFGYALLRPNTENLWCEKDTVLPVHEFHYWESTETGDAFHAQKPNGKRQWDCMVLKKQTLAGFPHFHFYGCPTLAKHLVELAVGYAQQQG